MTRNELIKALARKTGLPRKTVGRLLSALTDEILLQVKQGELVKVPGFATFAPVLIPKSANIDLNTGQRVEYAERTSMGLRPAKEAKRFLNQR